MDNFDIRLHFNEQCLPQARSISARFFVVRPCYTFLMKLPPFVRFIIAIAVCQTTGIIGSFFTMDEIPTWYPTLVRPDLAPPNWVFAPVWTTLFALMGIAAFLVWNKGLSRKGVRQALGIFGFQLVLNVLWSIIFFSLHSPGGAVVAVVALWAAIAWTIGTFWNISRLAAYLLIPYIGWVSFAAYLNLAFWMLN